MSRPFINKKNEEKVKGLLALLQGASRNSRAKSKTIEIKRVSALELMRLMELLLDENVIVLEEDLTPAQAAKIAGISRPLVTHLLKTGKLSGYQIGVGKHWKVKRKSLFEYIKERDDMTKLFGKMDKAGFGIE